MALGHVGRLLGPVDELVIPRHVFRRTRSRHPLVPLVGSLKRRIDIEDDAPVVEFLVMDDLAHEELGRVLHGASNSWVRLEKLTATRPDRRDGSLLKQGRCRGSVVAVDWP